jgi:hypothetical protein
MGVEQAEQSAGFKVSRGDFGTDHH